MRAVLMNKAVPVIDFEGEQESINNSSFTRFKVQSGKILSNSLCPQCLSKLGGNVLVRAANDWFSQRSIDSRRVSKISNTLMWGNEPPHYQCMSDHYWLRYTPSETWDDLSFYRNNYDVILGDILFSKNIENTQEIHASLHTPDYTTNGIVNKRWRKEQDGDYLIKAITSSGRDSWEAYNEVIASSIIEAMNIDIGFVKYSLTFEGGDLCCKSKNFIDEDHEFVPAWELYVKKKKLSNIDNSEHIVSLAKEYNIPGVKEFIDKLIEVDRKILNSDRHLNNLGFIRDADKGIYVGCAPLFDYGDAFNPYKYRRRIAETNPKKKPIFQDRENVLLKRGLLSFNMDFLGQIEQRLSENPFITKSVLADIMELLYRNNKDADEQRSLEEDAEKENAKQEYSRKPKETPQAGIVEFV